MIKSIFILCTFLITANAYSQNDTIYIAKNSKLYYAVNKKDSTEGRILKISDEIVSDTSIWKIDSLIDKNWIISSSDINTDIKFNISIKGKLQYLINGSYQNFIILDKKLRLNNYPIQDKNTILYKKLNGYYSNDNKIKLQLKN